jgi:hypothetical protein
MSAIDDVIARARQANVEFAERKQFKLARRRAIEKLRRFALADPYFYILEIIQAAVAGGADFVDIACGDGDVLISWTGAVLREHELAALFDFLFASKDRVDLAHVRSLALGVNALLLFAPEQVVIESGDGTPGNTARMVVRAGAEAVDVGRTTGTLAGTYVRATKLNREAVAAQTGRRGDENGGLEYATVELRCLAAPVPVVFNGQPLFGWARQRVPNLFGYQQARSFDEGDLYGSVGLNPGTGQPSFQLLTHGVWIQSYTYDLIKGQRVGGIVCFDRLHKTVDHSGFVQDDRFHELWMRLRPYAEALISGADVPVATITNAVGLSYSPTELRELLHKHPRAVVVPPVDDAHEQAAMLRNRAKRIAVLLDAELLWVPATQISGVRVLGGRDLSIWRPHLGDAADLQLYGRPPLDRPAEPWLAPPIELEPPTLAQLVEQLVASVDPQQWPGRLAALDEAGQLPEEAREGEPAQRVSAALRVLLGETGTIRATMYLCAASLRPEPSAPGEAERGLLVRVCSTGRLLTQRLYTSAQHGVVLDVELPTAQAGALRKHGYAELVAERFAALAVPALAEQDRRTLAGLGVGKLEPGSPAARLALQVLSRVTVTRLRAARPGRLNPGWSFSLLRPTAGFDPLALPLLHTVSGKPLSLRALALLGDATGGLVYATIPEVAADLNGLDLDRVLALDGASERALISLLGDAGYVRVDARDVLAEVDGVQIRDVALGLREYPDFPLLIEGQTELLDTLDEAGRNALLQRLLSKLIDRMQGRADEPGGDALALEEHRRQAVRHLQWFACRELAAGRREQLERLGLLALPLFIDIDARVWSLAQVHAVLQSSEGLLVHYGHVLGTSELGALTGAASAAASDEQPSSLAVSGFAYRLLAPLGRMRLAFEFDLDDIEAGLTRRTNDESGGAQAFLVRSEVAVGRATGVLGIPAVRLPAYRIQLRMRGRGSIAALDELARRYSLVGSLELEPGEWDEPTRDSLLAALDGEAERLVDGLCSKLPTLAEDPRVHEVALHVLLDYVGGQLTLIASPAGLVAELGSALAQRIASLPVFELGGPSSVQRMIERFRKHFDTCLLAGGPIVDFDWAAHASASTPACLRAWLDGNLQVARVVMPASSSATPAPVADASSSSVRWSGTPPLSADELAWNLEHWLEQLRPDPREQIGRERRRLPPTRVWVVDHQVGERDSELIVGNDDRVDLYGRHPLIEHVRAHPTPASLAWALLAVYAHLNLVSVEVSDVHEQQLQQRVADALLSGRLCLLRPDIGYHRSEP